MYRLTEDQLENIKILVGKGEKGIKVFKTSIGFFNQCSGTLDEKIELFENFLGTPLDKTSLDPIDDYLNERLLELHINLWTEFFTLFQLKETTVSYWYDKELLNKTKFTSTDIQRNYEKLTKFTFDSATEALYGLLFPKEALIQSILFKLLENLSPRKTNGFEYDNLLFKTSFEEETENNVQKVLDLVHCLRILLNRFEINVPYLSDIVRNPQNLIKINEEFGFEIIGVQHGNTINLDSIKIAPPQELREKLNQFLGRCDFA